MLKKIKSDEENWIKVNMVVVKFYLIHHSKGHHQSESLMLSPKNKGLYVPYQYQKENNYLDLFISFLIIIFYLAVLLSIISIETQDLSIWITDQIPI